MNIRSQSWSWQLGIACAIATGGAFFALENRADAQIVPDTTLGSENSKVSSTDAVDTIDGGGARGTNLFHSFVEFNVNQGRAAYFNQPVGIENIITRVTGANPSNILGTLGIAGGNANLFLINPNGIIFGPSSRLDVRGSFVGTTANAIGFGNSGVFSATNPSNPSLLTVNPNALLFNQIRAAKIENNSVADSGLNPSTQFTALGLRVPDGKSLLLVGGDINMDGAGLFAFGGRVELGGLATAGTVGLNGAGNNLSLSFPPGTERSDVSLSNGAGVNVTASDGGSIAVNARNLQIKDSELYAGIASGLGDERSKAGDIEISATGAINLNVSYIQNLVQSEANGQGGDVNVSASTLQLEGGAQLSATTSSSGKAGNITVDASNVQLIGISADGQLASGFGASAEPNSTGDAGNLNIQTNTLLVRDGAQVSTVTFGRGKGGILRINASDVQLIGESADGQISSGLASAAQRNSTGDAGSLTVNTNTLLVRDGAQIATGTLGSGKGGDLTVNASDVQLIGRSADGQYPSSLVSAAQRNSTGDAGSLTVNTNTLLVQDGAGVGAGTFGAGKGGDLTVNASDVQLIGRSADSQYPSGLNSAAQRNSTGDAGSLTVNTDSLLVQDGATVGVQSLGTGSAGIMRLNARSLRLDNNGLLNANTQSTRVDPNSEQATINIKSRDLVMRRGSNIRTNATGENVIGGNINIDTDFLIALENSDISANSANFRGGNVRINASGIFGTQFRDVASDRTSDITATGASPELGGTVELNIPNIEPNSDLVNLPSVPVDTEVAQTCSPSGSEQNSEFVVTGRGGLPQSPTEAFNTDAVEVDLVTLNPQLSPPTRASTHSIAVTPTPIVETNAIAIAENGQVILTANAQAIAPLSFRQQTANCQQLN